MYPLCIMIPVSEGKKEIISNFNINQFGQWLSQHGHGHPAVSFVKVSLFLFVHISSGIPLKSELNIPVEIHRRCC